MRWSRLTFFSLSASTARVVSSMDVFNLSILRLRPSWRYNFPIQIFVFFFSYELFSFFFKNCNYLSSCLFSNKNNISSCIMQWNIRNEKSSSGETFESIQKRGTNKKYGIWFRTMYHLSLKLETLKIRISNVLFHINLFAVLKQKLNEKLIPRYNVRVNFF